MSKKKNKMSTFTKLFGKDAIKPSIPPPKPVENDESYNCHRCGSRTSGEYLIVGIDDPYAPPYYGGRICNVCAKQLGAI